MDSYRERRARRVERLRGWAAGREARASAALNQAHQIGDMIPMGQPILVGHHSEGRHRRDLGRIDSAMRQAVDSSKMAERHSERADNIEDQMARSIYSDDPDAIPALEARIAGLEAERDRIKAYNASCRRGAPDPSLLDDNQRASLASAQRWMPTKNGVMPSYALANLNGNLKRNRDRLASLKAR
jgi:hypothetical protein